MLLFSSELISRHCPELKFLDVSFNKAISGEGLHYLGKTAERERYR
jgi:hypothetical protein